MSRTAAHIGRSGAPLPAAPTPTGYWNRPRDTVEGQVLAQWRGVRSLRPADIDVNFFADGGASRDAVDLAERLTRVCGRAIPVRAVYDHPTVRLLAAWLRATGGQPPTRVLPLNVDGEGTPLLVVPGAIGTLASLSLLGERAFGRPAYGIECHPRTGQDHRFRDLRFAAGDAADEVERWQSAQPLHLAGYCTGAVLAFELSHELVRRGWPVVSLTLLSPAAPDALAPGSDRLTFEQFVDLRLAQVARISGLDPTAATPGSDVPSRIRALFDQLAESGFRTVEDRFEDFANRVLVFVTHCYAVSRFAPRMPAVVPTAVFTTSCDTGRHSLEFWRSVMGADLDSASFDEHHMDILLSDEVAEAFATRLRGIDQAGPDRSGRTQAV